MVGGDFSPVSEKLDLGLVIYISTSNTDGFFFQTLERDTQCFGECLICFHVVISDEVSSFSPWPDTFGPGSF